MKVTEPFADEPTCSQSIHGHDDWMMGKLVDSEFVKITFRVTIYT